MPIEDLHNTGMRPIGDESHLRAEEKTLVVVGPARGGTSLVAGALHHLGVFMGTQSNAPVFEDTRLAGPAENRNPDQVEAVMREYDQQHATWGYKRPSIINNFGIIHRNARNPVYLFIFKDMFSISNRNTISMHQDVVNGLRNTHQDYGKIIAFLENRKPTGMLLSYDRVMQNREQFVDTMSELLPAPVSPEARQAAIDFIDPNPTAYLDASRITRGVGNLTEVSAGRIVGSAKYIAAPQRSVHVILTVDGETRSGIDARPGDDGHQFEFTLDPALVPGQQVELRLSEDVKAFATHHFEG